MSPAWGDYAHAADAANVEVRLLNAAERAQAPELWRGIWGDPILEPYLLTALSHAGNYVAGAFDGGALIGAAAGFFAQPLGDALHSHVAGVASSAAGRGVGTALKLHQRAWCLDAGVTQMTWTFDPLVARNATFNLNRLGATCDEYLVNHYGAMTDGINAGDESDRIVARWHLDHDLPAAPHPIPADAVPGVAIDDQGEPASAPVDADAAAITVALPPDIEGLRRADPERALRWRHAVRDALAPRLATGWHITAAPRERGYLLERTP